MKLSSSAISSIVSRVDLKKEQVHSPLRVYTVLPHLEWLSTGKPTRSHRCKQRASKLTLLLACCYYWSFSIGRSTIISHGVATDSLYATGHHSNHCCTTTNKLPGNQHLFNEAAGLDFHHEYSSRYRAMIIEGMC